MSVSVAKFFELEIMAESVMKNVDDYFRSHKVLYPDVKCPSKEEIKQYMLAQGKEVENTQQYLMKTTEDIKLKLKKGMRLLLD